MTALIWPTIQQFLLLTGIAILGYSIYSMQIPGYKKARSRNYALGGITLVILMAFAYKRPVLLRNPISMRMNGCYRQMDDPKVILFLKNDGTFYTNCNGYPGKGEWHVQQQGASETIIEISKTSGKTIDDFTFDWHENNLQLRSTHNYLNFVRKKT